MCLRPQAVSSGVGRGGHTKDRVTQELVGGRPVPSASFFKCPFGWFACPRKEYCPPYNPARPGAGSLSMESELQSVLAPSPQSSGVSCSGRTSSL